MNTINGCFHEKEQAKCEWKERKKSSWRMSTLVYAKTLGIFKNRQNLIIDFRILSNSKGREESKEKKQRKSGRKEGREESKASKKGSKDEILT